MKIGSISKLLSLFNDIINRSGLELRIYVSVCVLIAACIYMNIKPSMYMLVGFWQSNKGRNR